MIIYPIYTRSSFLMFSLQILFQFPILQLKRMFKIPRL